MSMLQNRQKGLSGAKNPSTNNDPPEAHGLPAGRNYPSPLRRSGLLAQYLWRGMPAIAFLLICGLALEHFAPESYKPSTVIAGLWGHEEAIVLRTKLDAVRATVATQNTEEARMRNNIENFRSRAERITEAYKTLYLRTGVMAQAMAAVQQQYLTSRMQLAQESQQTNNGLAQLADIAAAVGMVSGNSKLTTAARQTGQALRNQALGGLDTAMQQGVRNAATSVTEWQFGLPDMAEIDRILSEDRTAPMAPELPKPPPPAPEIYSTVTAGQ